MNLEKINPFGFNISKNEDGMLSLTDLWKASGKTDKCKPAEWIRGDVASQLIESLLDILKVEKSHLLKVQKGRGGNTFANKQLALAYAKWLDPKLHFAVNQIFFERIAEEKNPDLILDRAVDTYKRKGKTDAWIGERLQGKATRINFTKTLAAHGVTGSGYKDCTNAIYEPLWNGSASIIRLKKGIKKTANTRESMTTIELAAVRLVELLTAENIEKSAIFGSEKCILECLKTSKFVAQAVIGSQNKSIK